MKLSNSPNKKKVVSASCVQSQLPIYKTLTVLLALSYWHAPQWVWGVVGTIGVIVWSAHIYVWWYEKPVDISGILKDRI